MIRPEASMKAMRFVPIILSTLVLAAHFSRAGNTIVVVALALLPLTLFVRRPWVPGFYSGVLILGAIEWVRTLVVIAGVRQAQGAPWLRMAMILSLVALFTASSPLVFALRSMRSRYRF
jgi:hypothetical protein